MKLLRSKQDGDLPYMGVSCRWRVRDRGNWHPVGQNVSGAEGQR